MRNAATGREQRLLEPVDDVARGSGWDSPPARQGFFTDTSVCIGCKACEVACKEWNAIPEDGLDLLGSSYDNTGALGASSWRHVAFIEQTRRPPGQDPAVTRAPAESGVLGRAADQMTPGHRTGLGADSGGVFLGMPTSRIPGEDSQPRQDFRWLMSSDVCKHCTHAACLDVCPTGALFRTEFGTVVVQEDICNGCGYCVPACPFGVIDLRPQDKTVKNAGLAQKCTLCYDRLEVGKMPACAQACPTESIQFGELDDLRERAQRRVDQLHDQGLTDARLYLADEDDGIGGAGAFFLLLDKPETYGLPPDPVVTTRDLPGMWKRAALAAATLAVGAAASFLGGRR